MVSQLGFEEKVATTTLQNCCAQDLRRAVVHGHEATIKEAKAIFANETRLAALGPAVQGNVLKAIVRWGTEADLPM